MGDATRWRRDRALTSRSHARQGPHGSHGPGQGKFAAGRFIAVPASSPIIDVIHPEHLHRMALQAEEAHARRERAAVMLEVHGRDSVAARRGLQSARPIMGALRLKRLQLVAARWRATRLQA